MSKGSRRFLIGVGGAIVLVFLVAAVAIVAYNAGRNAEQSAQLEAPAIVVSAEGDSVIVESNQATETPTDAPAPTSDQLDAQETETPPTDTATAEVTETPEQSEPVEAAAEDDQVDAPEQTSQDPTPESPVEEEGPRIPVELDEDDVDLLLEVWEIVDEKFDGQLPERDEVTYSAIRGSLELLDDQFTRFIDPFTAQRLREQLNGSFEGIGAYVEIDEDGYLVIVRPIEDQPADRAGLRANDVVTHVDGESVLGMTLEEIIAEVKGPEGTEVTLTIRRESLEEPFDVAVRRARIELPMVRGEMLEEDIAYVRLAGFGANAAQQLEAELEELLSQDPRGLIVDLRDNPGGFLSQSIQVADLFLGEGVVLYERDNRGLEQVFESEDGDLAEEITLVILVNSVSASASEIVAGAVQDRERGILIGELTAGKGSVQQPHALSDGSELRVTIARWYTPDNRSIHSNGLTPDITVPTPEEFDIENDTQLQRAIRYLLDGG